MNFFLKLWLQHFGKWPKKKFVTLVRCHTYIRYAVLSVSCVDKFAGLYVNIIILWYLIYTAEWLAFYLKPLYIVHNIKCFIQWVQSGFIFYVDGEVIHFKYFLSTGVWAYELSLGETYVMHDVSYNYIILYYYVWNCNAMHLCNCVLYKIRKKNWLGY